MHAFAFLNFTTPTSGGFGSPNTSADSTGDAETSMLETQFPSVCLVAYKVCKHLCAALEVVRLPFKANKGPLRFQQFLCCRRCGKWGAAPEQRGGSVQAAPATAAGPATYPAPQVFPLLLLVLQCLPIVSQKGGGGFFYSCLSEPAPRAAGLGTAGLEVEVVVHLCFNFRLFAFSRKFIPCKRGS